MIYFFCFLLILIGIFGVLTRKNIVKIVISLLIIEYGVHLFLVLQGYRLEGVAPIIDSRTDRSLWIEHSVDPLPQALVLTSIVIGLGVLALLIALCIQIHRRFGTYDISKIRDLKG